MLVDLLAAARRGEVRSLALCYVHGSDDVIAEYRFEKGDYLPMLRILIHDLEKPVDRG